MLFGTVVYNIWTKRVGDLDYESINFYSKYDTLLSRQRPNSERERESQPGGP